jgi:arylamine N-acetyltransferase
MAFRSGLASMEEFAARNVHLSTSPESGFVRTLTVQRRDADGVDIVRGQVRSRVDALGSSERTIESRDEWFAVLADEFELPLDHVDDQTKQRLWDRVHATHEAWLAQQASDEKP